LTLSKLISIISSSVNRVCW